jgi:hypothetical protein
VTKTTTTRLISEQSLNLNSRKRLALKPKLDLKSSLWPSFSKKLMRLKGSSSMKILQAVRRGRLNLSSLLKLISPPVVMKVDRRSIFTFSKPFSTNKTKLAKSSHPTIELVVSLIVNNEEHLIRALADTGANSSSILEACTSAPFIKIDDSNTTTWSTIDGKFSKTKTGICL